MSLHSRLIVEDGSILQEATAHGGSSDFPQKTCWLVLVVEVSWYMMAHTHAHTHTETRFRLSAKRTSPFKSAEGRQFSRLLAAEVCASAVVMLDTPCSEVVWSVLATHSTRQFSLHFPSSASPCAITFQLESNCVYFTCTELSIFRNTINFLFVPHREHIVPPL